MLHSTILYDLPGEVLNLIFTGFEPSAVIVFSQTNHLLVEAIHPGGLA